MYGEWKIKDGYHCGSRYGKHISQPAEKLATQFERLLPCFRGSETQRDIHEYTVQCLMNIVQCMETLYNVWEYCTMY